MRKRKGSGFKMKSGNKTAFKMMGAKSPAKVRGAFIVDVDDLGNPTSRRATYDEARAAEGEGKTVKYTNKEFGKRMREDKELISGEGGNKEAIQKNIDKQIKDANRRFQAKSGGGQNMTPKQREFYKTQEIDALAQKEIEGKPLTEVEERTLKLARSLGTDTDKVTKTPKSYQAGGGPDVERVEKYPGARGREYGDAYYNRTGFSQYGSQERIMDDYNNMSDYEFEKKHGYPKYKMLKDKT